MRPERRGWLRAGGAALVAALVWPAPTAPAFAAPKLAFFGFELLNTSPESTRDDERARIAMLDELAVAELARLGAYEIVDTAAARAELAKLGALRDCQGCELDPARTLGAEYAAFGWVQKVSNLILNINMQVREVASGRLVRAGSVDIRGNSDESWRRGLVSLVRNRILGEPR